MGRFGIFLLDGPLPDSFSYFSKDYILSFDEFQLEFLFATKLMFWAKVGVENIQECVKNFRIFLSLLLAFL